MKWIRNDIKNSFAVNNKEEIVNHYVDILKYIALNNLSSELEYSPYITTEGSNFDEKHNIWNLRFYSLFIKPILKTKYSVNYDSLSI